MEGRRDEEQREGEHTICETRTRKRKRNTINILKEGKGRMCVCVCLCECACVLVARHGAVQTQACWAKRQRETW